MKTFTLTLNECQLTTMLTMMDLEIEKTKKWIKTDPTDRWASERHINLALIKDQLTCQR